MVMTQTDVRSINDTLRLAGKLFIINENGDYFWFDRLHLGAIRQFVLFRSGLAGSGAVRTLVRLISFPFTILYLLLYATSAHARRAWFKLHRPASQRAKANL